MAPKNSPGYSQRHPLSRVNSRLGVSARLGSRRRPKGTRPWNLLVSFWRLFVFSISGITAVATAAALSATLPVTLPATVASGRPVPSLFTCPSISLGSSFLFVPIVFPASSFAKEKRVSIATGLSRVSFMAFINTSAFWPKGRSPHMVFHAALAVPLSVAASVVLLVTVLPFAFVVDANMASPTV